MADLPPLKYGKVVGRFLANIADGPDIDDVPEFRALSGTVTFTAAPEKILVYGSEPPATVVQLPDHYVASLDEFGHLTWRDQRGIRLISPDAETNPSGWTWRVSFQLDYEGSPVAIAPYSIEVPPYTPGPDPENPDEGSTGLVDLTLVSPVPGSEGDAVVRGLSVVDVQLVGDALVFVLDNGDSLDPVTVPQITAATEAKEAAEAARADAEAAKADAEAARDAFDLSIGTVTTGGPGDPAQASVGGTSPTYVLNLVLPQGEQGPQGPPAPDADATTKGLVQLAGVLTGTAAAPELADDAVTSAHIAAGAVGASELADNAVDTAAIADDAVTAAKIAANAVGSSEIATGAVGADELADNAVDTAAIQDGAVTSAKIADGTIVNGDINAGAAIALSKLAVGRVAGSKNGTATSITIWCGTEAQYNAATSNGSAEDPNTLYFRGA